MKTKLARVALDGATIFIIVFVPEVVIIPESPIFLILEISLFTSKTNALFASAVPAPVVKSK